MSLIKREDGIKFIIQTYRETLLVKQASRLKEEVRALAYDHGEYVRLFKKNDEQIEAIFSKEPGFLLAESIWHYFNCPADLIYCEALPDNANALLVVVQRDTVYVDEKLSLASIQDELASFLTGDNDYYVYVYGNVPLSDKFESGKFTFPKADLTAFVWLQESVFEKLPADESLQMQPLNLALRTQKMGKPSPIPLIVTAVSILAVLALSWWYWSSQKMKKLLPIEVVKPVESPFVTYSQTLLASPRPDQLFEEFSNLLAFSASLPGWRISHIRYQPDSYLVDVKPEGQLSSLQVLERWLNRFGLKFILKKDGIQFSVTSRALKRQKVSEVANLDKMVLVIIDKLKNMIPMGAEIQVENEGRKVGMTRSLEIKIRFASTSPDVLILLGREILPFPVLVKDMNFSMDNNLLSGVLQLMLLGK